MRNTLLTGSKALSEPLAGDVRESCGTNTVPTALAAEMADCARAGAAVPNRRIATQSTSLTQPSHGWPERRMVVQANFMKNSRTLSVTVHGARGGRCVTSKKERTRNRRNYRPGREQSLQFDPPFRKPRFADYRVSARLRPATATTLFRSA